jgi:hypothetical protein
MPVEDSARFQIKPASSIGRSERSRKEKAKTRYRTNNAYEPGNAASQTATDVNAPNPTLEPRMKVGALTTRSYELLLSKVEGIAVNQRLLGKVFGYGNIVVTGSGGTQEPFADIQKPLEFRHAVQAVTDSQTVRETAVSAVTKD